MWSEARRKNASTTPKAKKSGVFSSEFGAKRHEIEKSKGELN